MGGSLSTWMDQYMALKRKADEHEIQNLEHIFNRAISGCEKLWGRHSFYKPSNHGWREQMISPLYDAQMVAVSLLSDTQLTKAKDKSTDIVTATRALFRADENFVKSVTSATNNAFNVKYRIEAMRKMINHVIGV